MRKKWLSVLLVLTMTCSLVACGEEVTVEEEEPVVVVEQEATKDREEQEVASATAEEGSWAVYWYAWFCTECIRCLG